MVCVLSTPLERECGGNATDFVCSAHLLQFTLYGNTVFNTLWYLFECAVLQSLWWCARHTGSESALVHTSLLKCQVVCHAHLSDWCGRYTWLVQLSVLGTHCKSALFYRSVLCTQW